MLRWIKKLHWGVLLVAAVIALSPLMHKPHLIEKLQMLLAGKLDAPMDVFDLLFHGVFALFGLLKLYAMAFLKD